MQTRTAGLRCGTWGVGLEAWGSRLGAWGVGLALITTPAAAAGQTPAPAQPPHITQEVIVTATAVPVPAAWQARTTLVLTRDEIESMGFTSLIDALRLLPGVDARARGPRDVQTDFSIRGATFGQHLVLVDGIRLNDSQSGHHNGEIPASAAGVDRIEVVAGPGSSVHGADALGGTINVLSRSGSYFSFGVDGGQHGYGSGRLSFSGEGLPRDWTANAWGSRSSGFMFDRDFSIGGAGLRGSINPQWTFDVRHQRRAFGANGFYGNSPSKEWTDQTLVAAAWKQSRAQWTTSVSSSFRNHGDHFLWDIRNPSISENFHRTNAVEASVSSTRSFDGGWSVTVGGSGGSDWVRSTNLSDHDYQRGSAFVEAIAPVSSETTLQMGLRYDGYSSFGHTASPSGSISVRPHPALRLRASAGHAFRIPTFTELYYRDPANLGSPDLHAEKGWSVDVGSDWMVRGWTVSVSSFRRWDEDVIDWVKENQPDLWRSTNVRDVSSTGIEASLSRRWQGTLFRVYFAGLKVDAHALPLFSKYVLEYARRQSGGSIVVPTVAGVNVALNVDYRHRLDGQSYTLVGARISRGFGAATVYVDGSNLLDERYREISTVEMPGRWITGGLSFDF